MNWIIFLALGALVVMIAFVLVFGCLSKYIKRLDTDEHGEHAKHPHG